MEQPISQACSRGEVGGLVKGQLIIKSVFFEKKLLCKEFIFASKSMKLVVVFPAY